MKVRVLFQDEGRFGRISDRRRCWGPLPKRPEVSSQVIREFIYSLTAVCPQDGQLASLIMPTVDTEIMSIFLAHTAQIFRGDFCLMFLDGAGWHRAHELRVPETMRLLPLPPYSPELNPVEGIWLHLRENYFGNRTLHSLDEVEDRLCQALHHLIHHPDLVRSITNYPWINTICLTAN
jgi:putative transposase